MKIYVLLLTGSLCCASEDGAVHNGKNNPAINNVVNLNVNTKSVRHARPGEKHPSVIKAHEELRRKQAEDDAVTCCCFIKLKKKI